MIEVTKTDDMIRLDGHAENKIVCAMVTALTIALVNDITSYLNEPLDCHVDDGEYQITGLSALSEIGQHFLNAFWGNFEELMRDYPKSFAYTDPAGKS